jgi:hypothetical protein
MAATAPGSGKRFLTTAWLLLLGGCATITGGWKDQKVKVTSDPPGAAVYVDGQPAGVTPAVVRVSRKSEHNVDVCAAGREPVRVQLHRHVNPWVFGNLLVGGLIGVTVDVCTDSAHCVGPTNVAVNLPPVPPTLQPGAGPVVPAVASGPPGSGVVPAGGSLPPR